MANVTFQKTDLASPPDATVVATETIAGAELQRMKLVIGASGVDDGDVSSANQLPVSGPVTDTELRATPIAVDSHNLSMLLEDLIDEVRKLRQVIELTGGISLG